MEKRGDTLLNVATTETSEICQGSQPENHLTPGDTSDPPMDKTSTDLVPQRLLDNQTGKECEAGVGLQREKDDILLCEDVEKQDRDLSAEERIFLEEFPILKEKLEEDIRKFYALADHIDKIHKTLTKTSVVTNSIAVISGAMSILGLALAPATAGGSLVLSAAGKGLGTAAGVTNVLTNVLEQVQHQKAQTQASSLVPTNGQEVSEAGGDSQKSSYLMAAGKVAYDCGSTIKDIKKNIRAFKTARAQPRLATAAKRLLTTGRVSARRSKQVQRAFEGTTLVMTRNARLLSGATTGFSLFADLAALLKDWKQLKEGVKSEFAEELRAKAGEQEKKLAELTQRYEGLKQKKLLQEKRLRSSSLEGAVETAPAPRQACGSRIQVAGEDSTTEPRGL